MDRRSDAEGGVMDVRVHAGGGPGEAIRKRPAVRLLAVLAGGLLSGAAPAQHEDTPLYGEPPPESATFQEPEAWKEDLTALPPYPRDEDLVKLDLQVPDTPFAFYMDPSSLSVGEDRVTRYVIVLESRSGARNVVFEGIRCHTSEHRTYAYGTPDGSFHPTTGSGWRSLLHAGGTGRYRDVLARGYLCDYANRPLPEADVRKRLGNPEHRKGDFFGW
jgi:hypothetical protein